MANFGKCLLFYLKYHIEMERLYEASEPNVDDLPNAEDTLEKIRAVGDSACREVAEFLEACAAPIENHIKSIAYIDRKKNDLTRTWSLNYRIAPTKTPDHQFSIGVFVNPRHAKVVPWMFCRDSRRSAEQVIQILGAGSIASDFDSMSNVGTVALAKIDIPIPGDFSNTVSCDDALATAIEALSVFTPEQIEALASAAGNKRQT